jgi:uncharacterized protein
MLDIWTNILRESWSVLGQMAPYLLFGFLVAGVLSVCISPEFVGRHLGGRGFGPVLKAALLGVPLPLCSCGVIPVAASFRRHGASRAATTSFLLSTPQTGVDSIAVTYALLGFVFAAFRPVAALVTGLVGGLLVMLFAQSDRNGEGDSPNPAKCSESCCADKGRRNVVWRALEYGFVALPRDIGVALLVGVVIAGVITAAVKPNELQPYLGGGILSIVLMMAVGIPIYVCASASVPIAAGLIHMGASPGAALAFLIAGPATNAATITTIWKLLGGRTAGLYLLTIAASAVVGGLTLDWLIPAAQAAMPYMAEHSHETMAGSWLATSSWAVLLLLVVAYSYAAKPRAEAENTLHANRSGDDHESPERLEFAVSGMTCNHCVTAVTHALGQCRGVASVQVDLTTGRAVVAGEHLNTQDLIAAVASAGYRASTFV